MLSVPPEFMAERAVSAIRPTSTMPVPSLVVSAPEPAPAIWTWLTGFRSTAGEVARSISAPTNCCWRCCRPISAVGSK